MRRRNRLRSWTANGMSKRRARYRPALEPLERRDVPSALAVADVTVREGPAALGALDPAGAVALGLDHPRLIAKPGPTTAPGPGTPTTPQSAR